MSQQTSQNQSILSVQNVILASVIWGLLALFIFLLGSPIDPRPGWYNSSTYILENTAFAAATFLCLRNWRSSKIVSGRTVWLLIGLGMLCYFTGNLLFGWYESVSGVAPDVSPADFLYLLSYLLLGIGMLLAVLSKQLNLSLPQWITIAAIAILGIILAYFVSGYAGGDAEASRPNSNPHRSSGSHLAVMHHPISATTMSGWFAQAPAEQPPAEQPLPENAAPADPAIDPVPAETPPSPEVAPVIPSETVAPTEESAETTVDPNAQLEADNSANKLPPWMQSLNDQLEPLAGIVWILYLTADIFLVVMATTLLLAFWGGRFSLSWRFIAAAGFCFYIADMWYYYALDNIENYESGALPEVFWIFSGVLFCIGAALEYSLSTRSRRGRRRST
ncbi:MAG: hypothetical protein VKL39_07035 [Leptolyngbyaceae bacterium]|nr:hypothetical protein [Leptolyngbyaceae bacterium]